MTCGAVLFVIVPATDPLQTPSNRISRRDKPVTHTLISRSHGSKKKWGTRSTRVEGMKGKKLSDARSLSSHIELDL
jgi:hypothetical protein